MHAFHSFHCTILSVPLHSERMRLVLSEIKQKFKNLSIAQKIASSLGLLLAIAGSLLFYVLFAPPSLFSDIMPAPRGCYKVEQTREWATIFYAPPSSDTYYCTETQAELEGFLVEYSKSNNASLEQAFSPDSYHDDRYLLFPDGSTIRVSIMPSRFAPENPHYENYPLFTALPPNEIILHVVES